MLVLTVPLLDSPGPAAPAVPLNGPVPVAPVPVAPVPVPPIPVPVIPE
jgi:hypothetical protein